MKLLAEKKSPVVLSGDIHSTWVSDLRVDFDKPETPAIAAEFCTTSISSDFDPDPRRLGEGATAGGSAAGRALQPATSAATAGTRWTAKEWRCDYRVVDDVKKGPTSPVSTESSWVVEAGGKSPQSA